MKLVSAILPVYNESKNISACLESLLNQDYLNLEIIIQNNLSEDVTYEISKKYFEMYPDKIKLFRENKKIDGWQNLTKGISQSSGYYTFFVGADDLYEYNFVSELVNLYEKNKFKVNLIMCASREIRQTDKSLIREIRFDENFNHYSSLKKISYILTGYKRLRKMKYNFFIRGLFNSEFLKRTIEKDDKVILRGDRYLPVLSALEGSILYLNKILYIRQKNVVNFTTRNPNDQFTKRAKKYPVGSMREFIYIIFHLLKFGKCRYKYIIASLLIFSRITFEKLLEKLLLTFVNEKLVFHIPFKLKKTLKNKYFYKIYK